MAAPSIQNTLTWAKVSPVPAGWWNAGALTFDATVKAIVVTLSTSAGYVNDARFGGVAMTKVADSGGSVNRRNTVWLLANLSGVESGDAVEVYIGSGAYQIGLAAFALAADGEVIVLDAAASEAVVASISLSLDSGGADGLALGSGSNQGYYPGNLNLGSGQVQTFYASTSYHRVKGSRKAITGAGTFAYSHSGAYELGVAVGLFGQSGHAFRPAPFGAEAGFADGVAFVVGSHVRLFAGRLGAEAGFAPGLRFTSSGPRQVMLTGAGLETPETTEGGSEGQVLTFHIRGVPTWGDGPASVIEAKGELIVGTGPGAVDHLPAGTDGWLLSLDAAEATGLRWVSPSGASVDFGETGDIADLDFGDAAAAGSTGEVADAGHVHGMPADPVAVLAQAKGDLIVAEGPGTPSRLPVGADGELLTADSGAPAGVAWAPAAVSTPPALRVFLYQSFK